MSLIWVRVQHHTQKVQVENGYYDSKVHVEDQFLAFDYVKVIRIKYNMNSVHE